MGQVATVMQPRYAVITGASRGLGSIFARMLAARKRNLVLVARSKEKLDTLARELRDSYAVEAVPLELDLASHLAGQRLSDELRTLRLQVDLLVNNAGFGLRGEFSGLPIGRQMEMIRLNTETVVELTCYLLPMIRKFCGSIVNVASAAGFQPIPYAAVYAATKAFLLSFSLGLEHELRPHGVKVVTLCPGRIRTDSSAEGGRNVRGSLSKFSRSPEAVVRDTLKALDRGGGLVVPGMLNKAAVAVQRILPRRVVPRIVARLSRV